MLKRQTVALSVAARGWPGVGASDGLRRECGAPGRGGSRSPPSPRRPAGARGRRGSAAESERSSRSRCRPPPRLPRSARSSEPPEEGVPLVVSVGSVGVVPRRRPASGRSSRRRCRLAALAVLERALDVVLRARVVADVARQDLDRVVVAVERRRSRRRGRCRTSRRSPARPHDSAAPPGDAAASTAANAATTTSTRSAPRTGSWAAAGIKVVVPGRSPRELRGMVQSLSDGIEVRVSGW